MIRCINSELTKLMTVKSTKILIGLFFISFLYSVYEAFEKVSKVANHEILYDVDSSLWNIAVGQNGMTAGLLAFLLGTILVTSEYRYNTIVPTFLATQNRSKVLIGKITVVFMFSALYLLILSFATFLLYYFVNVVNNGVFTSRPFYVAFSQGIATYLVPPIIGLFFASIIAVTIGFLVRNSPLIIVMVLSLFMVLPACSAMFAPLLIVKSSTDLLPQIVAWLLNNNPFNLALTLTGGLKSAGANLNSDVIYDPLTVYTHITTSFSAATFGLLVWSVILFTAANLLLSRKDA